MRGFSMYNVRMQANDKHFLGGTTYHLSTARHNRSREETKHHKAGVTIGVRTTDVLCAALFLLAFTIAAITGLAQFPMPRWCLDQSTTTAMHPGYRSSHGQKIGSNTGALTKDHDYFG